MILASDIRMKSGAMIMPAGTKLASHGISKLQMYVEMDNISKEIFILKTSM
jgi:hypothetical protein